MSQTQYQSWLQTIQSVRRLETTFLSGLQPAQDPTAELNSISGEVYLASALASVAGLKINRLFAESSVEARVAIVRSASDVFAPTWSHHPGNNFVNPVLGVRLFLQTFAHLLTQSSADRLASCPRHFE